MEHRRMIELVIVGLWLAIAIVLCIHYNRNNKEVAPIPDNLIPITQNTLKGKSFSVRRVIVLHGDSFDLTVNDKENIRLLGKLPVMATENSKEKVLDLLNHSTKPRVVLREKQSDGHWTIDFFFISNDKEINLVEWLSSNNLVYK